MANDDTKTLMNEAETDQLVETTEGGPSTNEGALSIEKPLDKSGTDAEALRLVAAETIVNAQALVDQSKDQMTAEAAHEHVTPGNGARPLVDGMVDQYSEEASARVAQLAEDIQALFIKEDAEFEENLVKTPVEEENKAVRDELIAEGIFAQDEQGTSEEIMNDLNDKLFGKRASEFIKKEADLRFIKASETGIDRIKQKEAQVEGLKEKNEFEAGSQKEASALVYRAMRKFSLLEGVADRWEAEEKKSGVEVFEIRLSALKATGERYAAEMKRKGVSAERRKELAGEIEDLDKESKEVQKEMMIANEVIKRASEDVVLGINEKLGPQSKRHEQIEKGIEDYRKQIDEFNTFIREKQAEKAQLAGVVNASGLRSFDKAISKANKSIEGVKKQLSELVIEGNKLGLKIKKLEVVSGAFGGMSTAANKVNIELATTTGLGRLIREGTEFTTVESAIGGSSFEGIGSKEGMPSAEAFIAAWNNKIDRANKGEENPLSKIMVSGQDISKILEKIKKELPSGTDLDADALSPRAFKLFVEEYFKGEGVELDKNTQNNIALGLREALVDLDFQDIPSDFYETNVENTTQPEADKKPKRRKKKRPDDDEEKGAGVVGTA